MDYMATQADNAFDLAVVDPPYGIKRFKKGGSSINKYGPPGEWNNNKPNKEYFTELSRVSDKSIVFGGNYFDLPISGGWMIWYREDDFNDRVDAFLAENRNYVT